MRSRRLISFCLAIGTACLVPTAIGAQGARPAAPADPLREPVDLTVMHAQVILDRLGFSPGVIDGRTGESFKWALRGFQQANNLTQSGELDPATLRALYPHRQIRPVMVATITPEEARGPFVPTPADDAQKARLQALPYQSLLERLAERYHTTPETLVRLNSRETMIGAGRRISVPGVMPASTNYSDDDAAWNATLAGLGVGAEQPEAALVTVDKSDGVLRVFDAADKLIAQFPATMGSRHDPLPLGNWTIRGVAKNPDWRRDPELLRGVADSEEVLRIPPGPNNPVGVVWIDLSKEHYGIHGTSEPAQIGRAESNGCIRLTNWDVARLSLMVKPGTRARFVA
ncbi:lipoprotein-anchoring transpeptidase ErfK/SrfK [Sphingomonas jejuensis]|uniref:Lipoprotein-anchoring transpeptidase ErfK/SrfK n=1 Tax=Sphingomonas jejuensis TaxID=904715 RepID=A0ABX0XKA7_9SPHN|nr:L,D-transpeptidase family protein [Sphingomonas jejuensis]NJC33171.1 lipoprotein-anchoring transpeptidase ErfK/SrfK [Sphingomonas jejuensis]